MNGAPPSARLLVLDDDEGILRIITRRMERQGHQVVCAASGKAALDAAREPGANFDLILLDYKLPDTNAEELINQHWEEFGNPAFIVLTGFGDERLAVKLMKLGAEDYITKDADFLEHLVNAVSRTLRHLQERRQLDQAEQQLLENKERLDLALHSAGISIWDINLARQEVIICDRWRSVINEPLPPNPAPLAQILSSIHPEDREYFDKRWRAFVRLQSSEANFEAMFRLRGTGDQWIESQGIVVARDSDGAPTRIICTLHDVSAKVRMRDMEEQLRRAQRMDTLGSLAGGIAHDFNNVLASIMGYNELTQRDPSNIANILRNAEHINRASQRARDIIKQVLLYSRRTAPEVTQVNLVSVVDEAVGFIRAVAPPTVSFATQHHVESAIIDGDASLMSQVITNLLNNAVQAMKDRDGVVHVSIREHPANANSIDGLDLLYKAHYVLEVRDEGPGIPENLHERIFEPFFSTKRRGEGTGLGLATSQSIVNSHGGRILVQSQVGQGACFQVFLPQASQAAPKAEKPVEKPERPSALRILLVDDEIALLEVTTQLLMMYHF